MKISGTGHGFIRATAVAALCASALAVAGPMSAALAQSGDTITIIVPFSPGGANDSVARLVAQHISEQQGQIVIVENRPGGGATVGMNAVAQSAPDGRTYGLANISFAVNPYLLDDVPYDPKADFEAVALMATFPFLLVVHPSVPANTTEEFVALAKERPGELLFSSAGYGSGGHLSMELFALEADVDMVHVPYAGGAEHTAASLAGDVTGFFSTVASLIGHVQEGSFTALGVTSAERSPLLPDVPTLRESGIEGLAQFQHFEWSGLLAPAGTPREEIDQMNEYIVNALADETLQERLAALGGTVQYMDAEEFQAHLDSEMARWEQVVETNGLRADN